MKSKLYYFILLSGAALETPSGPLNAGEAAVMTRKEASEFEGADLFDTHEEAEAHGVVPSADAKARWPQAFPAEEVATTSDAPVAVGEAVRPSAVHEETERMLHGQAHQGERSVQVNKLTGEGKAVPRVGGRDSLPQFAPKEEVPEGQVVPQSDKPLTKADLSGGK